MMHKRPLWALAVIMAVFLGALAGGAGAFWWLAPAPAPDTEQRVLYLEHELMLAQGNLIQVQASLDAAQANATVESSTRKALESTLQATQLEVGQLRDQLAFFNELLPPAPAGAVAIRALDFEPVGPTLQYRVLLMRSGTAATPFQGALQFIAHGLQDGKAAKIELWPAQAAQAPTASGSVDVQGGADVERKSDGRSEGDGQGQGQPGSGFPIEFDQFQRSGGVLSVPSGFLAQTITLNVLEGSTVRVSRTVSLPVPELPPPT